MEIDNISACLMVVVVLVLILPISNPFDRKPHNFTCPCCMRRAEFSSRKAAMRFSVEHLKHCKSGTSSPDIKKKG